MRVNGMSQWIMWEVSALFENIGTVYDGMAMMTKAHDICRRAGAPSRCRSPQGRDRASTISASTTARPRASSRTSSLDIQPGEKIGLVGRSGAGKTTLMNLLLRFYDLEAGRIRIDGQDIADGDAGQPARARSAW